MGKFIGSSVGDFLRDDIRNSGSLQPLASPWGRLVIGCPACVIVHCSFVLHLAGHFGFKVARSTVVAFYIRIEHVDRLIKCCAKINGDLDGQEVSRIGG